MKQGKLNCVFCNYAQYIDIPEPKLMSIEKSITKHICKNCKSINYYIDSSSPSTWREIEQHFGDKYKSKPSEYYRLGKYFPLEKCPVCAGKARLSDEEWVNRNGREWGRGIIYKIVCTKCGIQSKGLLATHPDEKEKYNAIKTVFELWNKQGYSN